MSNKTKAYSTMNVIDEQSNVFSLPPKQYIDKKNTYHRVNLRTICDFASEINESNIKESMKLIFYVNDDLIPYEWNQEYKSENNISNKTNDKDIYKKLISIDKNIQIEIKGKDAILSLMNRLGIKKWQQN